MTDFAVLYRFHRADALSLNRLKRLISMNPDVIFIPCYGVQQFLYIPLVHSFRGWKYRTNVNKLALASPQIFRLSKAINEKLGKFIGRSIIANLDSTLGKSGLRLYCDFTPMQYGLNADLAILEWYDSVGRTLPFDHLVYCEYDEYMTKTIQSTYGRYAQFDAGFVDYEKATSDWFWFKNPPGARRLTLRWLITRGLEPVLYRSLLAGSLISKNALEALVSLEDLPYCQSEMRLPTVLTALGFKCAKLDFPMVRYRPPITRDEIHKEFEAGIFHPVYSLTEESRSPV